ncbi:LPS export ABC transporter periplasmic protein LptC [Chlorobium sp. N1]|uniref:LPS export ABC transporter periplasmic protein LptC n=1 Tax=Chlorobium sp. N1 TaxID=2491138 RepID=UPI00103F97B3|nr:LPS export ABC transporter periplasmic protein LptC [Chlorobium sp. N1]TCD48896.1 LPS export ABC transporter periplasmic protein LptC [Chlorobium sp. N1]
MGIPLKHSATLRRGAHTLLLILCTVLIAVLSGCASDSGRESDPNAPVVEDNSPLQESWQVEFVVSEEGVRKSLIRAGHVTEFRVEGKSEQHLDQGVKVEFFDAEGQRTTEITADRAVVYDNQDIEGMGHVVIRSSDNTVIRTEYAKRSGLDRRIRSDRFVTIDRPDQRISGYGFESDQEIRHYRIFRGSGEGILKQ